MEVWVNVGKINSEVGSVVEVGIGVQVYFAVATHSSSFSVSFLLTLFFPVISILFPTLSHSLFSIFLFSWSLFPVRTNHLLVFHFLHLMLLNKSKCIFVLVTSSWTKVFFIPHLKTNSQRSSIFCRCKLEKKDITFIFQCD